MFYYFNDLSRFVMCQDQKNKNTKKIRDKCGFNIYTSRRLDQAPSRITIDFCSYFPSKWLEPERTEIIKLILREKFQVKNTNISRVMPCVKFSLH